MADILPHHQPDAHTNNAANGIAGESHPSPVSIAAVAPSHPSSSAPWSLPTASENVTTKRQRRPSVRLGEIGDQPAALVHDGPRRTKPQQWRGSSKDPGKSSKTRQLAKLAGGHPETLDFDEGGEKEANFDNLAIGSWKTKESSKPTAAAKKPVKRPRTMWLPRIDGGEGGDRFSGGGRVKDDSGGGDYNNDGDFSRDFGPVGSDEQSPAHSLENLDRGGGHGSDIQFRRPNRSTGDLDDHHHHHHSRHNQHRETYDEDDEELDGDVRSDNDRNGAANTTGTRSGSGRGAAWGCSSQDDGVKIWLNGLGLGRYWPVFEIHEVDEEVLPMLTLEDLKDMGINAVGSRRKMFNAIQKLGKGFS